MLRKGLWVVPLALLALPLAAEPLIQPDSACASRPPVAEQVFLDTLSGLGGELSFTYIPNCNDCTLETPCETECGWEPGKGGPVTCGEYGALCT